MNEITPGQKGKNMACHNKSNENNHFDLEMELLIVERGADAAAAVSLPVGTVMAGERWGSEQREQRQSRAMVAKRKQPETGRYSEAHCTSDAGIVVLRSVSAKLAGIFSALEDYQQGALNNLVFRSYSRHRRKFIRAMFDISTSRSSLCRRINF